MPEIVLSEGAVYARAKWSFALGENIMKMVPTERSQRTEKVSAGITSIGITSSKLWPFTF